MSEPCKACGHDNPHMDTPWCEVGDVEACICGCTRDDRLLAKCREWIRETLHGGQSQDYSGNVDYVAGVALEKELDDYAREMGWRRKQS